MAWRIAKPEGREEEELHHTNVFEDFRARKQGHVVRIQSDD